MLKSMECFSLEDPDWQVLVGFLPKQWQQWARDYGALTRLRNISSPEALLRLLLLHVAAGLSLRQTVVRAREHKLAEISDVALLKRLRNAGPWLQRISQDLCLDERRLEVPNQWLRGFHLRAVDSTVIHERGAKGTQWRVHYSVQIPSLECDFFKVTTSRTSESLTHYSIQAGDLILADRGYCRSGDLQWVKGSGGEFVVRLHSTSLPLKAKNDGKAVELLRCVQQLEGFRPREWEVQFEHEGRRYSGRLCLVRRSAASAELERQKVLECARTSGQKASEQRLELAKYILLLTSIPKSRMNVREVLRVYRLRWQIELSFKRLKSLLELGLLPKYDPTSSRAWLQGKLLTALLIERMLMEASAFSPWGFREPEGESMESVC
jgi:hypothetical protein